MAPPPPLLPAAAAAEQWRRRFCRLPTAAAEEVSAAPPALGAAPLSLGLGFRFGGLLPRWRGLGVVSSLGPARTRSPFLAKYVPGLYLVYTMAIL